MIGQRQRKIKILIIIFILYFIFHIALLKYGLNYFRERIALEMLEYNYPNGKFGIDAKRLEDLVPEAGGTPMRSVIVSSWRSGSTFLGDLLNSAPGNYYHYEPLLCYGIKQIRGPPNDTQAILDVKKLLTCDYTNMDHYIQCIKNNQFLLSSNERVWDSCTVHSKICYHPRILGQICKLYPLQSMKLVRLRLNVAQQLLDDASLAIRILLLVRDPRGVLQSRKHETWCHEVSDCGSSDPEVLCSDMVSDYKTAVQLTKKFPLTFKAIRYEDFTSSVFEGAKDILQFYGIPFNTNVESFLQTHTKKSDGMKYSTYRNAKSVPFKWVKKLTFDEINKIQESCKEAMQLWGYKLMSKLDDPESFNPLLPRD